MRSSERKALERSRKRAQGLKPIEVWVHPVDVQEVREYVRELLARRGIGREC